MYNETYLQHHGILGPKWGIRRYRNKDGSLTPAGKKHYSENYEPKQITRDQRVYGKRAVNRINKRMKNGESISSARSAEAERINSARRSAKIVGQVGSVVGALGGGYAEKMLYKNPKVRDLYDGNRFVVQAGMAAVGSQLGRYAGHTLTMLSRGYSPSKYR